MPPHGGRAPDRILTSSETHHNLHYFAELRRARYNRPALSRIPMLTDKQIEAGAKALAADASLPGGGLKKLARLVSEHLYWFDAAEKRGMTWGDMSRLLFAAGVRGPGGRPIPIGTLSSTVWRKRQKAISASVPEPPSAQRRQSAHGIKARLFDRNTRGSKKPVPAAACAKPPPKLKPSTSAATKSPSTKTPANNRSASRDQTLAFMKRAAALRRSPRE